MKKIAVALALTALAAVVFAQELKLKGEAKSGIYWLQTQDPGDEPVPKIMLHSTDDAGDNFSSQPLGRIQLDLDYDNGNNLGLRVRFRWEDWTGKDYAFWQYAFGYGNFFDNQLTVSVGKLGASPWGTGGPEMWKELEIAARAGGMRIEIKPSVVPGLNAGFVLNSFNQYTDLISQEKQNNTTILHLLQETVIGISYTHDLFHARFAYRLDSDRDSNRDNEEVAGEEDELLYRIEERAIANYLPGFKIWAMGYFQGVRSDDPGYALFQNWLFTEYDPGMFTAQIRLGYDYIPNRSIFHVKPSFYWHLFDRLISVGASFWYGQDFGEGKMFEGSPYLYIEAEPKVQINFASSYIALVYNWHREYTHLLPEMEDRGIKDPIKQRQWINLRFCLYF